MRVYGRPNRWDRLGGEDHASLGSSRPRSYIRSEQPGALRALALLPDVGREPCRHPADDRGVRGSDRAPVPDSGPGFVSAAGSGNPPPEEHPMWTTRVRERAVGALPPETLLPDRQPSY